MRKKNFFFVQIKYTRVFKRHGKIQRFFFIIGRHHSILKQTKETGSRQSRLIDNMKEIYSLERLRICIRLSINRAQTNKIHLYKRRLLKAKLLLCGKLSKSPQLERLKEKYTKRILCLSSWYQISRRDDDVSRFVFFPCDQLQSPV